jgi:copper(I)-binding protein
MIYLAGGAITTVTSGSSVPFANIPIAGSNISLPSTGNVRIANTGYYSVTFGVMATAVSIATAYQFQLRLAGAAAPVQQIIEFLQPATEQDMYTMTTIVQITVNPTTLTLVNTAAASATLNNASNTAGGAPAAYMQITQLR